MVNTKCCRLSLRSKMSFLFAIVCILVAISVKLIEITMGFLLSPSEEDVISVLELYLSQDSTNTASQFKQYRVGAENQSDANISDSLAYEYQNVLVEAFSEEDSINIFIPSVSEVDLISISGQGAVHINCQTCRSRPFTLEEKKRLYEGSAVHHKDNISQETILFFPVIDQRNMVGLVKIKAFIPSLETLPMDYIVRSQLSDLPMLLLLSLALGVAFGFLMSRNIVIRLSNLHQASANWAEGKFGQFVTDNKSDEIAELSKHLNGMARKLEELMREQTNNATWEERSRISRDLHDTVKQKMFALQLQLSAAEQALQQSPDKLSSIIQSSISLSQQSREDLGTAINALRPAELINHDFCGVIRRYVNDWSSRTGISVDLSIHGKAVAESDIEDALYKILQEVLANVEKHAMATLARIIVDVSHDSVLLIINDNGCGVDQSVTNNGHGLRNIKERVDQFGGQFILNSSPDQGTSITAKITRRTNPAKAEDEDKNGE